MITRLAGWGAFLALLTSPLRLTLWLLLDHCAGITGYEVQNLERNPAAIAQARSFASDLLGLSEHDTRRDWISAVYGRHEAVGDMRRFLFVPGERILTSDYGTLIHLDRGAGEEFLQSRTVRNLAVLMTMASLALTLALGLLAGIARLRHIRGRSKLGPQIEQANGRSEPAPNGASPDLLRPYTHQTH